MFTICPKCALTLVVTAADLRIAQGYVRCGRCLNVFNALARLAEERPAAGSERSPDRSAGASSEQAESPQAPAPPATGDDTGEIEIELDASVLVTSVRPPVAPDVARNEPEAQADEPSTTAAVPGASERASEPAAVAQTSAETMPAPSGTPPPMEAASASPPSPLGSQAPLNVPRESTVPREAAVPPETAMDPAPPEARDAQQTNSAQQPDSSAFELEARRPTASLAWKLGACALAIALALQIVNHYRDALAASPVLGGPLSTVYSALGVKLAPRWNIHAYDVRQLGASVAGAAAGEIIVRASVKNSATRAQPLPLLRVTLQDRFGNRIAARDVPPVDYLPSSVAPSSLLAAGGRVDATMMFVDPGPQAVGFEIDACLPQQTGEVACAHGP